MGRHHSKKDEKISLKNHQKKLGTELLKAGIELSEREIEDFFASARIEDIKKIRAIFLIVLDKKNTEEQIESLIGVKIILQRPDFDFLVG